MTPRRPRLNHAATHIISAASASITIRFRRTCGIAAHAVIINIVVAMLGGPGMDRGIAVIAIIAATGIVLIGVAIVVGAGCGA